MFNESQVKKIQQQDLQLSVLLSHSSSSSSFFFFFFFLPEISGLIYAHHN